MALSTVWGHPPIQRQNANSKKLTIEKLSKGHFPIGGIFLTELHFLLFKDQLAESGRQKTKENIIPRGKFRLVENGPKRRCTHFGQPHSNDERKPTLSLILRHYCISNS